MRLLKLNHDHMVKEMDDVIARLKSEQKKNAELMADLQKAETTISMSSELHEKITAMQRENEVLRETNDKLIKSALNFEKESSTNQIEEVLKEKVSGLESNLANELKSKTSLQEELKNEKEKLTVKTEECIQLQEECNKMKTNIEELEEKLNLFRKEDVDFDELGEAVALLKLKKQKAVKLSFLDDIPEDEPEDLNLKLKKAETDHLETIKELSHVREMLMTQYKLNKNAQDEIKHLTEQMEHQEKEYQAKLEEYAHLLDIRASRIQKLERQLNDIAYGTKTFTISTPEPDIESLDSLEVSRGENIFELHFIKIIFSNDGLEKFKNNNPSIFLTWNFYEFELQSTPVVKADKPNFNFTAQYSVQVDDFFLYFLYKNSTTIELHESLGTDFRTIAACQLNFSDLIEKSHERLHATQHLIGVEDEKGIILGNIEYWARLKIPMKETFNLYKEKFKALKYIRSNIGTSVAAMNLLNQPYGKEANTNHLHIKITRCMNLRSNQKDIQPSAYCIYKFYDLPDQDTTIIPASNNPEFSDHRTFPLFLDSDLDKYLKTEELVIYVFDDNDPEISSHIGKTTISLLPLAQNKSIKGIFELKMDDKSGYGSIEVFIYWQDDYEPFKATNAIMEEMEKSKEYSPRIKPVISLSSEYDEELIGDKIPDYSVMPPPVPKPRSRSASKKITSTPIETQSERSSSSLSNHDNQNIPPSPSLSSIHQAESSEKLPPQPAARSSKQPFNTIDDFIAYGKSIIAAGAKAPSNNKIKDSEKDLPPPKPPRKKSLDSDVMSGKKTDLPYDEISDDDKQAFSEDDSEEDIKDESLNHSSPAQNISDTVLSLTIEIIYLILNPEAEILKDPSIKNLFVEYRFLDYPLEELETPFSLPKLSSPDKIYYNFKKDFQIDINDEERLLLLAQMFDADLPEASWIKFTIVSEPPSDEQDLDCEDVGYAFVDLREIVENNKDIIAEDIIIYDANDNVTEIGHLNITIKALDVLLQLQTLLGS